MLKKWISGVIALVISISCLAYGERKESLPLPGTEIVSEIKQAYQRGDYDLFLKQLNDQFLSAGKAGVLRGIFESAKTTIKSSDVQRDLEKNREEKIVFERERNKNLLNAISKNPDLEIVQKVDAVVFSTLSQEQFELLQEFNSLKYEIPKDTAATIENKVSALEVEYYIKSLLLDIAAHRAETAQSELENKKLVLVLDKLNKMEMIAHEFSDAHWIEKISKLKEAVFIEKSHKYDLQVLKNLAEGKIKPENSVEEKVKQIMMDYLQEPQGNLSQIVKN